MRGLIFSSGILNIPHLAAFLPESELLPYARFRHQAVECVYGWGLKPTSLKARNYATQHNLPYIALEDGFLRSTGLGVEGYPPFSMVVDDLGIYYDTRQPSRLEQLILAADQSAELLQQASLALAQIRQFRLSKYNHAPDFAQSVFAERPIVLVLDQTFGDMAVQCGQADAACFEQMLHAAIAENPHAEIWVKTHPDVISGKKKGYLTQIAKGENVRLLAQDCNPLSLLAQAEKVYCVTSQMGFEALMLGKTVVTFGVPWFAGWGISDDRHPNVTALQTNGRRAERTFLQLFAAAYLQYSRYIDPNRGTSGSIFDVIDYLHRARQFGERVRGTLYCVGMSLWKRAVIKPFFRFPQCRVIFTSLAYLQKNVKKQPLAKDAKLLIWSNGKPEVLAFAQQYQLPILRMEDGFIRSVGLGSNLVAPLSLVTDDLGIYFNAQMPSRLEYILQNQQFSKSDLARASALRQQLIQANIGKYNVGSDGFSLNAQGKRTLLVPGQVEDDASIRSGSPVIKRNLDLLKAVRAQNPDAYILYKPHPDVVSGNRIGKIDAQVALQYANEIVEKANILDCIMQVDEVHTMTSLAGFEALLRGKVVHCYGLPFYSNWGLTIDQLQLPRRSRLLTLTELLAAVLIYYPLYVSPANGQFINAEMAIAILKQQKAKQESDGLNRSWLAKQWGKVIHLCRALF
ncbi:capsular polysaccharide biosynthesis protein [Bibersteinia trehalosi]|uniref:capsular polysaccharide biosynthesis protein n=1 Tax=Bibersteinia trehalosi TaxID=47735 RepID=UPI0040466154